MKEYGDFQRRRRERIVPNPEASLREQVHEVMRFLRYSPRTEEAYWHWVERFLRYHRVRTHRGELVWRHPRQLGVAEVREFLTHLATALNVSASTQNQALNALVFLYGEVLHQSLGDFGDFARAKRLPRMPVVLSRDEVKRILAVAKGPYALSLKLLYGTGMRLFEMLRLRVKDATALLRDASAGGGHRYSNGSGIAGAQRRRYDADLHPCVGPTRDWGTESAGRELSAEGEVRGHFVPVHSTTPDDLAGTEFPGTEITYPARVSCDLGTRPSSHEFSGRQGKNCGRTRVGVDPEGVRVRSKDRELGHGVLALLG
jgi:hypothetical protein